MKDYNSVALITLSLFISAAFCSAGDSYSQLYNPHGVKILSPTKEQEVPTNIQNFKVEGVSTDNSTNNCDVSLLLNGITPYVKVSPTGQNGSDDFSVWEQVFHSNFHLNVGENKLTAKLLCSDEKSNQITKYHSVNFTGTNETISTPVTKVLNQPSTREDISPTNITELIETESPSSENETISTPVTKVLNQPPTREDISPTNITELIETESPSSDLDDQAEFMSEEQVVRKITSGPVIIPPREIQETTMFNSSIANDSVIIPNATSSGSATDNGTSPIVLSSSSENGSSPAPLAPLNNQSYLQANQVSKEIPEQSEFTDEKNGDIPLIFPTPSPRVSSIDDDRDDSVVDSPVQELSPVIKVENNNTKIEEGSLMVLNATQSYSRDAQVVSYAWKQLTGRPLEYVEGLNMPILKFRAPSVSQDTPLEFEISVLDALGKSSNGMVNLSVSDTTSLIPRANTSSNILNQTESQPHTGDVSSNVKKPDSSESNLIGTPNVSNTLANQAENYVQATGIVNPPFQGDENSTSIRTMAGVDQIVNEGMEVILNGDSNSTNSGQLSYEWRQIGGDVKVSLGQQNAKQTSFEAPAVDTDSKLTFRFIASVDGTQISSDDVNITISDVHHNLEKNESSDPQDGELSEKDDNDDDDDN